MRVFVSRVADDGLSHSRWAFDASMSFEGARLRLVALYRDSRERPKGRFKNAPSQRRWEAHDERRYNSGLARPISIPQDVIDEAWASIPRSVYIGWLNEESRYA